jgi:hypothetical protein
MVGWLSFDGSFNIDERLDSAAVVMGAEVEGDGGKDEEGEEIDAGGGTVANEASWFLSTEIAVNNRKPGMS